MVARSNRASHRRKWASKSSAGFRPGSGVLSSIRFGPARAGGWRHHRAAFAGRLPGPEIWLRTGQRQSRTIAPKPTLSLARSRGPSSRDRSCGQTNVEIRAKLSRHPKGRRSRQTSPAPPQPEGGQTRPKQPRATFRILRSRSIPDQRLIQGREILTPRIRLGKASSSRIWSCGKSTAQIRTRAMQNPQAHQINRDKLFPVQ